MMSVSECEKRKELLRKYYLGGDALAICFGQILGESVAVIRAYEIATKTAPLNKHIAFLVLDTLFYTPENKDKRGFTLTAENIEFIKQYVHYIICGRIGWHVDEYIAELSRVDV